jgi:isopentenyl-diphosphate delta-isomerase
MSTAKTQTHFVSIASPDMSAPVVLVDEDDSALGTAEKLRAHTEGWLHRALSVFVFDETGRLLLQRRAPDKYHSGGLWSNTCCSHPYPDESPKAAARRRLHEEMGFSCSLTPAFHFTYRAPVGGQLTEHEYDHVFVGVADEVAVQPNPAEVSDWTWVAPAALRDDVAAHPDRYTVWFRRLLDRALAENPSADPCSGPQTPSLST